MVIEYLREMGFKDVHAVVDGKAALDYLSRNAATVGLVVSDWDMPELNGLQLLQTCKGSAHLKDIPFLMITSQSSIESMKVVQAARASVDDYLLKPFSLGDIRSRIEGIINKERTKTEVEGLLTEALDYLEHRHYVRAERKLEAVLKLHPENETALRNMGDIKMKEKASRTRSPITNGWSKATRTARGGTSSSRARTSTWAGSTRRSRCCRRRCTRSASTPSCTSIWASCFIGAG